VRAIVGVGEGLFEIGLDPGDGPLRRGYGGDAPNAATMAALAGAQARICTRVGDDAFGRLLVAFWDRCGIDTRFVRVDGEAPTGIYVNESSEKGHRFHYHRTGSAGSRLRPDDLTGELLDGVAVVHVTGITLAVAPEAAVAALARAPRSSFAVNYRPALRPDVDALLTAARSADVVFISDDEADALLGAREPQLVAEALGARADELVVTSGSGGGAVLAAGVWHTVPAPAVTVVDAAGAGDALAGCYLAERTSGRPPADALRVAIGAASLSCTRSGCAASYPRRAELDAFLL
jgi:2-dehydro-3-deoxygluconokinase